MTLSAVSSSRTVSGRSWRKERASIPLHTGQTKGSKSWKARSAVRERLEATKQAEREFRAEQEAQREARLASTRARKQKEDEKARIEAAAQKMSAKRLQRFKKRLGKSKKVAH